MSDQSTSLRDQLIEAGVWSAGNPADPETDRDAASFLFDQVQSQLADGVMLIEKTTGDNSFTGVSQSCVVNSFILSQTNRSAMLQSAERRFFLLSF
jgi:hypothetical protein